MLKQLLSTLFESNENFNHHDRRADLVHEMNFLEEKELSCQKCIGNCCTFTSNSMRITPLEAMDILFYLNQKDQINSNLIKQLEKNIEEFRLDKETLFGIKKNYTCPFYLGKCKGCSISRWNKPYGCLAFNATEKNVLKGTNCSSNQKILKKREDEFSRKEKQLNQYIIDYLSLSWTTESIPVALLDIIKKGEKYSP